jgi:ArsR family transcriptional regulator, arsenate/arsenite/antimonite-responsive transcriptional repressor
MTIIRNMSNNENEIDVERYSEIFKALSNPHRLKIFLRLISCCAPGTVWTIETQESASVGDLAKDLDIVPSTVSHHMKELRHAGLIKMRRSGQKIECWLDPEIIGELERFFGRK